MTTTCLLAQATNPKQYNNSDWSKIESSLKSKRGTRNFFFEAFDKKEWKRKKILDLGCGTGWLVNEISKVGAKKVIGVDPSERNITWGKQLFPEINIYQHSLESFPIKEKFDYIISIMTFNHVSNVDLALQKISYLLEPKGRLQIIIPSYDYFRLKRNNYRKEFVHLSAEEYVVKTNRKEGEICDVIRTLSWFVKKMEKNDFQVKLIKAISLCENTKFIFGEKRFLGIDQPIAYFMELENGQKRD
jgi:2-polyprenyl-3-methyl-5-hydroxy-6-metoxy-1,4-benzoquinol methylase